MPPSPDYFKQLLTAVDAVAKFPALPDDYTQATRENIVLDSSTIAIDDSPGRTLPISKTPEGEVSEQNTILSDLRFAGVGCEVEKENIVVNPRSFADACKRHNAEQAVNIKEFVQKLDALKKGENHVRTR